MNPQVKKDKQMRKKKVALLISHWQIEKEPVESGGLVEEIRLLWEVLRLCSSLQWVTNEW